MWNPNGHWILLGSSTLFHAFASGLSTPRDNAASIQRRETPVDDSGNAGYAPENYTVCDYSAEYDSLFDLNAAIAESGLAAATAPFTSGVGNLTGGGTLRSDCVAAYALHALVTMMNTAYDNYTSINDGYDTEFGYYIKYMEKTVPEVIDNVFMFDTSQASATEAMAPVGPGMKYFDCKTDGSSSKFPCTGITSQDHVQAAGYNPTTLTLKDGMEDDYNAALLKAGITPDWVHFGDHTITHDETSGRGGRNWQYQFSGFPIPKANMDIPNPKDIVTKALPSIPQLRIEMKATLMDITLGNFAGGSTSAAADAYSTPVFMLMQAVDNMAQAKALGEKEQKEEEEQKTDFIVMIVSVVLLFVPIVGEEAATAAGMATLARAIAIAGEAGNGALAIYDTVKNPSSAVVNILGMLMGIGAISKVSKDATGLSKVAKVAKSMSPDVVKTFGAIFKNNVDTLQTTMKFCKY